MKDHNLEDSSGAPDMGAFASDGYFQNNQFDPYGQYASQGQIFDPNSYDQGSALGYSGQSYDPNLFAQQADLSFQQSIQIDPTTGQYVQFDPVSGQYIAVDPQTGQPLQYESQMTQSLSIDPATGQPLQVDPVTGQPIAFDPFASQYPQSFDVQVEQLSQQIDPLTGQYLVSGQTFEQSAYDQINDQSYGVAFDPSQQAQTVIEPTVSYDEGTAQYYDPLTGWIYDVQSGYYVDPQTGQPYDSAVYVQQFYPDYYYQLQYQQSPQAMQGVAQSAQGTMQSAEQQPSNQQSQGLQAPNASAQEGQSATEAKVEQSDESKEEQEPRPKKRSKLRILLVIIIIALVAALGGLAVWYFWPEDPSKNIVAGSVEGMTLEEIQQFIDETTENSKFQTSIVSVVVFDSPDSEGVWRIENSEENVGKLMQVTVTLDDTGETVYETGMIKPGYHIQTAPLDTTLDPGNYKSTATFTAYDEETGAYLGESSTRILIQVKDSSD